MSTAIVDEQRYRCCFGTFHVERGALIIVGIEVALVSFSLLGALYELSFGSVLLCLVDLATCVCVVLAQKRHEPRLYVPYLIMLGVSTALLVFASALCVLLAAVAPTAFERVAQWQPDPNATPADDIADARVEAFSYTVALILIAALAAYSWRIVYLAREYMVVGLSSLSRVPLSTV